MPPSNPVLKTPGGPAYVDFFSLIFSASAYRRWYEWKHPREPITWKYVREFIGQLPSAERKNVQSNIKLLGDFVKQASKAVPSK